MERKSSTFSRAGFKEVSGAQEQNHRSGFSSGFHHKEMKEKAWELREAVRRDRVPSQGQGSGFPQRFTHHI